VNTELLLLSRFSNNLKTYS